MREAGRPGLGRGYWLLWSSSTLSNVADGIVKVALPLVAVTLVDSPALVAGVAFLGTLPWLLFALPAGALADRVDRRTSMLVANLLRAAVVAILVLVAVLGWTSLAALYAVALCLGIAEVVYDTSAQSILPQLIGREQLSRANGRLQAAELTANEFVGPPLGGVLVATGAAVAFATSSLLWAAAVGILLLVRGRFQIVREHRSTIRADVAEGLRFLWRSRLLRTLAFMTGQYNLATNAAFAVFVLYAVGPGSSLDLSEVGYGLLLAALAAGGLTGALLAEQVERRLGRPRSLSVSVLGGVVVLATPALTSSPLVVGVVFFAGGAVGALWNVIAVSLRQRVTPDGMLGRVNSAYRLFAWGTRPIGALAGGLLGELVGLKAVFLISAVLALSTLLGMTVVREDTIRAAERAFQG